MQAAVVYVGDRLQNLRTLERVDPGGTCGEGGAHSSDLARVERDEADPRPTTLRKLAQALNVHPRELIEG